MEWFQDWFNTHYYHILYGYRDDNEASSFLGKLIEYLNPPSSARVLDLACGRGRHSKILSEHGLRVLGVDLSENNISEALKSRSEDLEFKVHDMRYPIADEQFDYVFNLFTSFGYFEDPGDDLKVLESVYAMLNPGGMFILDYLNPGILPSIGHSREEKVIEGIQFRIEKRFSKETITKRINLDDNGVKLEYHEKVRRYTPDDFKNLFLSTGFEIAEAFGDYSLKAYHQPSSERMIIISRKNA